MPLIIPKNIPAYEILKKNAFVMGDSQQSFSLPIVLTPKKTLLIGAGAVA